MPREYFWENAPLIEVIAEVHWSLKTIMSSPGARIDPYYDLFLESFLEQARRGELAVHEELIPGVVPIELTPKTSRLRLRYAEGKWPLVQVGPGILTANITPPYRGWTSFEPFLHSVVRWLFESYPIPDRALRIDRLSLRYIDGFDTGFGFTNFVEFADSMLGIPDPLSSSFKQASDLKNSERHFMLENRFPNVSPENSTGILKVTPGKLSNNQALILELHCNSQFSDRRATETGFIYRWFSDAHRQLNLQFESLVTDQLRETFGEKRELI